MEHRKPGYIAVITSEVRYDNTLRPNAKLLYGEITALAGADGYCWATNDYFAQLYDMDKKSVSRLVSQLQKRGHIRIDVMRKQGGKGAIDERRIYIGRAVAEVLDPIHQKVDTPPPEGGEGIHQKVEVINRKNDTSKNDTPISPPKLRVPMDVGMRLNEYTGADKELLAALCGLLENRQKANKKPVKTVRALNGILCDLDKLSGGDRATKLLLLDKAITSNWLTVYPLKSDDSGAGRYKNGDELHVI